MHKTKIKKRYYFLSEEGVKEKLPDILYPYADSLSYVFEENEQSSKEEEDQS